MLGLFDLFQKEKDPLEKFMRESDAYTDKLLELVKPYTVVRKVTINDEEYDAEIRIDSNDVELLACQDKINALLLVYCETCTALKNKATPFNETNLDQLKLIQDAIEKAKEQFPKFNICRGTVIKSKTSTTEKLLNDLDAAIQAQINKLSGTPATIIPIQSYKKS